MKFSFKPKFIQIIRCGYTFECFKKDAVAGIVVGLMAIPLAIGFGIASIPIKVPPELPNPASMGIYTAIIAGALVALFEL